MVSAISEEGRPTPMSSDGYAPGQERPLAAYAGLSAAFGAALAGALLGLKAAGRELPECPSARDIALAGVATHKVSRLLAKDKVTSFLRAPFTEYQESSGQGELEESPRGRGLRLAGGEVLVCPYSVGAGGGARGAGGGGGGGGPRVGGGGGGGPGGGRFRGPPSPPRRGCGFPSTSRPGRPRSGPEP